ncbi:MAG: hypothetical protein C0467_22545 [Planctomycetaceae bacterium]|nr:hypothetical protein [Planctomycetaceae bacterium]
MLPFHVHYSLTRRQRVGELLPWLPALAASIGFGIGGVYLSSAVTLWFLLLFLLPIIFYRGLLVLLIDLATRSRQPVELTVDETTLWVQFDSVRRKFALDDIFQMYRTDDMWTLLHRDNSSLHIPVGVLTEEQLKYLKSFARRAAEERKAIERQH